MTAQQKEDYLVMIEDIWEFYQNNPPDKFKEWLKKRLATLRKYLTVNSHDYSVIALRENDTKPLFEFNTDSLIDARTMYTYWAKRIRNDAMLILQDNNATDCVIEIKYAE